jgi:BirA family biotin operon repressor/biotin-[acetyl-CoA-carboxylase] ligase
MDTEKLDRSVIGQDLEIPVEVLDEIDSTNTEARRRILRGEPMPQMILAERQSAGRGRQGKSFFSPPEAGVYLSFAFACERGTDALLLTTSAAVAAHLAIRRATGISCGIEWVNDLYVEDRKVAGILAESLFLGEKRYVILGIGVNLYPSELPMELRDIAGSLLPGRAGLRNALAAELCCSLARLAKDPCPEGFMEIYRANSLVLGKDVVYWESGERHEGLARSIDERGRLLVRKTDGEESLLGSGEITLRWKSSEEKKRRTES